MNDDLTPIRAKVTRELRKRDDVARVHTVNEKKMFLCKINKNSYLKIFINCKNRIKSYLSMHVKELKILYESLGYLIHFVHSIF